MEIYDDFDKAISGLAVLILLKFTDNMTRFFFNYLNEHDDRKKNF